MNLKTHPAFLQVKPEEEPVGADFQRIISNLEPASSRSSTRSSMISYDDEEKIAFPQMSVIPSYNMPFGSSQVSAPAAAPAPVPTQQRPSPAPSLREVVTVRSKPASAVPARMQKAVISSPKPASRIRPNSSLSISTDASGVDPFQYSEKLSINDDKRSDKAPVNQSRWSRGSSELQGKPAARRWMIE